MPASPPTRRFPFYCVMSLALVFPSLVTWLYFVALADRAPAVQGAAATIGKLLQFALPLVWVFGIERRRVKFTRPRTGELAIGFASGAAIVAAMLALYFLWALPSGALDAPAIAVREKVTSMGLNSLVKYAALGLFYALVHSLLEEYYWRWFAFGELRRVLSFWPAATLSSVGFMAHHVILLGIYFGFTSPLTYFFALSVAVGGMIWAWLYERTGSLWGPWLSHLLVDAGIFYVGWLIVRGTLQ
jgi:membrane protease YdiL (CAAX protease family)